MAGESILLVVLGCPESGCDLELGVVFDGAKVVLLLLGEAVVFDEVQQLLVPFLSNLLFSLSLHYIC